MTLDADAVGIVIKLVAAAASLGWFFTYLNGRREQIRKDKNEPVTTVVGAATELAGAVEDILKPLREEIRSLHQEVEISNRVNGELRDQLQRRTETEHLLRQEVTALRLEVAALRGVVAVHGIDINHIINAGGNK